LKNRLAKPTNLTHSELKPLTTAMSNMAEMQTCILGIRDTRKDMPRKSP